MQKYKIILVLPFAHLIYGLYKNGLAPNLYSIIQLMCSDKYSVNVLKTVVGWHTPESAFLLPILKFPDHLWVDSAADTNRRKSWGNTAAQPASPCFYLTLNLLQPVIDSDCAPVTNFNESKPEEKSQCQNH